MTTSTIHRIYFGFDGKPDPYLGYLKNWQAQLPDFEIRHWNASNLPMDVCRFVKEMHSFKDHAFLSDYFRWWVIREFGGIYFDADIEVVNADAVRKIVQDLEHAEDYDAVIGIDNREGGWYTGHSMMGKRGSSYSKFMCEVYEDFGALSIWRRKIFYFMSPQLSALYFCYNGYNVDGMGTSPHLHEPIIQSRVKIFPQQVFSPLTPASRNGKPSFALDALTPETAICHHFSCSWHDDQSPYRKAKGSLEAECVTLQQLIDSGQYSEPAKESAVEKGLLRRFLRTLGVTE